MCYMNVLVAVDGQFFQTPDGKVWTKVLYPSTFWDRYLLVFDKITVISRMKQVEYSYVDGFIETSRDNVDFIGFPMAIGGAWEYIKEFKSFSEIAKKAISWADCAIIRLPSISAMLVEEKIAKTTKPYALEIIADPKDAFAENRIVSKFLISRLKKAAKRANGVSYVTQYALQKEYPPFTTDTKKDEYHFDTYYSSITLEKSYFDYERDYECDQRTIRIVHVANNMNNYIKGHKETMDIVKKVLERNHKVKLTFVGDGRKREEFEIYARNIGIAENVEFLGALPGPEAVRSVLLKSDILLFPTKGEGLPRVIIEAMAVGLPVISSNINGIPELLEKEDLKNPQDIDGFVKRLEEFVSDGALREKVGKRNIKIAEKYENTILTNRRAQFYEKLKAMV